MATCVVIDTDHQIQTIQVDDSDMSPFTQQALNPEEGQKVTILGSWDNCAINMLGLSPNKNNPVPENMLPQTNRESAPLSPPIMFCRLDENYRVVDFDLDDYRNLVE